MESKKEIHNVTIQYRCPKCDAPVGVYLPNGNYAMNNLEISLKRYCDSRSCSNGSIKTVMRIESISGNMGARWKWTT